MNYTPKSNLAKCLEAIIMEVGGIAPMAFAKINIMEAMREADRAAEVMKYDGCDGCSTGDCNHDNRADCVIAQGKIIAEQAAQIAALTQPPETKGGAA